MTRVISGAELRKFATPGEVHVDALMTDFAINYGSAAGLAADRLFPYVDVLKASDKYAIFNKDRRQERIQNTVRAPRTAAKTVDWSVEFANYDAVEHALAAGVDDQERDNTDAPIDPDQRATRSATLGILIDRENDVATKATTIANYPAGHSATLAGVNQWSDPAASNPKADIDAGREKVLDNSGVLPNTMLIPWIVVAKLKLHNKITDAFKYVQGGVITEEMLASYFEIPNVVITAALKNTAAEGQAAALSKIWGKHVVLAFVDPNTSPLDGITFGKTFRQKQLGQPRLSRRFREEKARTDWFEVSEKTDPKITAGECGYLIRDAVA